MGEELFLRETRSLTSGPWTGCSDVRMGLRSHLLVTNRSLKVTVSCFYVGQTQSEGADKAQTPPTPQEAR